MTSQEYLYQVVLNSFPGRLPVSSLGSRGLGVWVSYSVVANYHKLEWFPFFMVGGKSINISPYNLEYTLTKTEVVYHYVRH